MSWIDLLPSNSVRFPLTDSLHQWVGRSGLRMKGKFLGGYHTYRLTPTTVVGNIWFQINSNQKKYQCTYIYVYNKKGRFRMCDGVNE